MICSPIMQFQADRQRGMGPIIALAMVPFVVFGALFKGDLPPWLPSDHWPLFQYSTTAVESLNFLAVLVQLLLYVVIGLVLPLVGIVYFMRSEEPSQGKPADDNHA
jgi:hypothetical protein